VTFADRTEAGRELAGRLSHLAGPDLVVLGVPRGGVPVADQVARALHAPLDVIVARKVGLPARPELAMGAVGEGGVVVVNDEVCRAARVPPEEFLAAVARERAEVDRQSRRFRAGRAPLSLAGKVALVVDDGLATGSTTRVACQLARVHGAARVVLAVPVGPRETSRSMRDVADEVVCPLRPRAFQSVGEWYADFGPTSEADVVALLQSATRPAEPGLPALPGPGADA
jgi:putative phosphoribosyl transferase